MSLYREAEKSIGSSMQILMKLLETDTEISLIDLNLLENLNTNQSLNYIKLEQNFNALDKEEKFLSKLSKEYEDYKESLGRIESMVDKVEAFTKEIDSWSKEIEQRIQT